MIDTVVENISQETQSGSKLTRREKINAIYDKWNVLRRQDVIASDVHDYVGDFAQFVRNEDIIDESGNLTAKADNLPPPTIATLTSLYLSSVQQVFDSTYTGDNPKNQLEAVGMVIAKKFETSVPAYVNAVKKGIAGATENEALRLEKMTAKPQTIQELWEKRKKSARFSSESHILSVVHKELKDNPKNEKNAEPHLQVINRLKKRYDHVEKVGVPEHTLFGRLAFLRQRALEKKAG